MASLKKKTKLAAKKQLKKAVIKNKKVVKSISKKTVKPSNKKLIVNKNDTKPKKLKAIKSTKPVKNKATQTKVADKKNIKQTIKKIVAKKMVKKTKLKKNLPIKNKVKIVKPVKAKKLKLPKAIKPVKAKKLKLPKAIKPVKPKKLKLPKAIKPVKPKKLKLPKVVKEKPIKELKIVKPVKPIKAPTTFRINNQSNTPTIPEPKGKYTLEFNIKASEDMMYDFLSTESGLSEWFCNDVSIKDGIFTFWWGGQSQQAKLVKEIPPYMIKYQWLDKNDGSYFEFRLTRDELTNDISLIITDFAADKDDEISAKLLWQNQIEKLLHILGS